MSYNISANDCKEWEKNKEVNPITGKKIKKDGPVYKKFEERCKNKTSSQIKEVVFDRFRNSSLKKKIENVGMHVTEIISDASCLVVIKSMQTLIDRASPAIRLAEEKKIPLTSVSDLEQFIKINQPSAVMFFIDELKTKQYPKEIDRDRMLQKELDKAKFDEKQQELIMKVFREMNL